MPILARAAPATDVPERGRRRATAAALAIVLVLVAAVFVAREIVWFMRAATVLSRSNPMPLEVRAYLKLRRAGVRSDDLVIPAGDHVIPVRVYTPLHRAHPPVIVLVHGFAPNGNQDDYLDYLAVRMTLAGFQAVVPNITSEQFLESRTSGVHDIGEAVKWSSERAHARVSLFGVSFGGGLALAAAEDPAYSPYMRMVFDLSGYDSLQRLAHYYIHDRETGPGGAPYPSSPPLAGTILVALQHLDELVPADQVTPLRKAMFMLFNSRANPDWAAVEAPLTPAQRQTLESLLNVTSQAVHDNYVRLIDSHSVEDAAISPAGKLRQLRCPLYALHGTLDPAIPAGEAEWERAEIPPGVEAHFMITPEMGHVAPLPNATRWQKMKIAFFVADALQTAASPSPLGASPSRGAGLERRALAWFQPSR